MWTREDVAQGLTPGVPIPGSATPQDSCCPQISPALPRVPRSSWPPAPSTQRLVGGFMPTGTPSLAGTLGGRARPLLFSAFRAGVLSEQV